MSGTAQRYTPRMRTRSPMRFLLASLLLGCGASVSTADPADAATDTTDTSADGATDGVADTTDTSSPPIEVDATPPPMGCTLADPLNPPLFCGPAESGATPCTTTTKVDTCPSDNPCMARVKQGGPILEHRMGRMRLWAPDALLSLAPIAFDPNVNARCCNGGNESLNWLFRIDRGAKVLEVGSARASADGAKFSFLAESFSGDTAGAICPGFVGPSTPLDLRPIRVAIAATGTGFQSAVIASLNIANFDRSGSPIVLPLREVTVKVPSISDPSCIGSWDKKYWCDGDSLGWTTGGSIVAKITAEDADRVPLREAGCQSLCAILVNDATKTSGRTCKRSADGKVPEIGTHCVGGTSCKNAFLLSVTFGSYGVDIAP